MMTVDEMSPVVVGVDACGKLWIYHQDFPEAREECAIDAVTAAAGLLSDRLARGLDHDLAPWQRVAVQQTVAEVRSVARKALGVRPGPSIGYMAPIRRLPAADRRTGRDACYVFVESRTAVYLYNLPAQDRADHRHPTARDWKG